MLSECACERVSNIDVSFSFSWNCHPNWKTKISIKQNCLFCAMNWKKQLVQINSGWSILALNSAKLGTLREPIRILLFIVHQFSHTINVHVCTIGFLAEETSSKCENSGQQSCESWESRSWTSQTSHSNILHFDWPVHAEAIRKLSKDVKQLHQMAMACSCFYCILLLTCIHPIV